MQVMPRVGRDRLTWLTRSSAAARVLPLELHRRCLARERLSQMPRCLLRQFRDALHKEQGPYRRRPEQS